MDDQDKKPVDAESISDEELDDVAGGVVRTPEEQRALRQKMREARQRFIAEGGKPEDFRFMVTKKV